LDAYESYTPLKYGTSNADLTKLQFNKDAHTGRLVYSWQRKTSPLSARQQFELVMKGVITQDDALFLQLKDTVTKATLLMTAGTINWNDYRKKYVMIGQQVYGTTSILGEIWYSESSSLVGPWTRAVKIVTHHSVDFYNPMQHKYFDAEGGRVIYFEGTFVNMFDKGSGIVVPRYDYNQQMYKLDLSDPRLHE